MNYRIVPLNQQINRKLFQSSSPELTHYFQHQVGQDMKRRLTSCFVLINDENQALGYYTLSAAGISLTDLPPHLHKKLPRYPSVPAIRMGRLAVNQADCGKGFGGVLLIDALQRAAATEIGAYALLVDAKDQSAVQFYQHYGFMTLQDTPNTLLYPLASFRAE